MPTPPCLPPINPVITNKRTASLSNQPQSLQPFSTNNTPPPYKQSTPPCSPPINPAFTVNSTVSASNQPRSAQYFSMDNTPPPRKKKNFLDSIPLDVASLLGTKLSSEFGNCFENVYNLAQVSPEFNRAMLHSCGYILDAVRTDEALLVDGYLRMFIGCIKGIRMYRLEYYEERFQNIFIQLLKSPTLTFASMEGPQLAFNSFPPLTSLSTSLRELHVTVSTWETMQQLRKAVEKLDLRRLRICCDGIRECIYSVPGTEETWEKVGVHCPNLEALDLACVCEFSRLVNNLKFLIMNLPSLKTFTLGLPDMESLMSLVSLDSLTLRIQRSNAYGCEFQAMAAVATRWAGIVKGLEMDPDLLLQEVTVGAIVPAEPRLIFALNQCARLQVLHLGLLRGSEDSLPSFASLKSLHLRFVSQYDNGTGVPRVGNRDNFYTLDNRFCERIVATGFNIKSLGLYDVRIGRDALNILLKGLGDGLQEFGVTIWRQNEGLVQRLLAVLELLGKYSSGLRKILGFPTGCHLNVDGWWIDAEWYPGSEKALTSGINVLKRRARRWDWKHFVKLHGVEEIVTRAATPWPEYEM